MTRTLQLCLIAFGMAVVIASRSRADSIHLRRVASGMAAKVATTPQRLVVSPEPITAIKKLPGGLTDPGYATIILGPTESPTRVLVVANDVDGPTPRLWVDADGDGDLTNDPAPEWSPHPYTGQGGKSYTMWAGGATVAVRYGAQVVPLHIRIFRYDRSDPQRALSKGTLEFTADYGYEGEVTLGGVSYKAELADSGGTADFRGRPGGILFLIDVNGDGKFDTIGELYDTARPFNIKGTTYEIVRMSPSGDSFDIVKSPRSVPEILPPPDLRPGKPAPPFVAKALSGRMVKFPEDFRGKVVLLVFFSSWCPDCQAEIPNLVKNYEAFHGRGLEMLGISMDAPGRAAQLAAFVKELRIAWEQIYDGKHEEAALGRLYGNRFLPTCIVVDGDSGKVIASERSQTLGAKLAETLTEALARPK